MPEPRRGYPRNQRGRPAGGRSSQRAQRDKATTWLSPELVDAPILVTRPWMPSMLTDAWPASELLSRPFWYLAIDEIIEDHATVRITPWPWIDEQDRLRFPHRELGFSIDVEADELQHAIDHYRQDPVARELTDASDEVPRQRPLRVGDVFATRLRRLEHIGPNTSLVAMIRPPFLDVSAEARETAKVQQLAAVAPVLNSDQLWLLYRERVEDEDEGERPEPAGG